LDYAISNLVKASTAFRAVPPDVTTDLRPYRHLDFYEKIIKLIVNNDRVILGLFKKTFTESLGSQPKFWNAYCENNYQIYCEIPNIPEISAKNILYRFINDDHFFEILGFTKVDPFYKKYLKYKNKYLQLINTSK
jgi:hypothetical protein